MIAQNTEKWLAERVGALTSTRAAEVFGTPKARLSLVRKLTVEIALAERKVAPRVPAIMKGINDEPLALAAYRLESKETISEITTKAYIESDLSSFIADSPDGLINTDGVLEIKNLSPDNHYIIFDSHLIPNDHMSQCLWHLMVTKRKWCDYFSYCKELPVHLRSCCIRIIARDMGIYEEKALSFIKLLMDHLKLRGLAL